MLTAKSERRFKEPCGGKTIEHGTFMSEETMELMKKYDSYLVPSAGKEVEKNAEINGFT
jgi:imidazolonepropionase-like amidohydrolase